MTDVDTKTKILDSAEKLFATNGFAGVSLRAIIKEAGVNTAAIHYHFSSKEGLMEAVLERRAAPMNAERLRLLEDLEIRHPSGPLPLEALVTSFLGPALRLHRGPSGDRTLFARLLGRAVTEPDKSVREMMHNIFGEVFVRFSTAFARSLPDLPDEEVQLRLHFMVGALAFTVAGQHAFEDIRPSLASRNVDRLTKSLVDFVAAGMRTPFGHNEQKRKE